MAEATPVSRDARKGRQASQGQARPHGQEGKEERSRTVMATVQASFNNTIVSIADQEGNVLAWSSAGRIGFKGSRKGTPFAAQLAAANCAEHAKEHGVRSVDVRVTGPGRRPRVGDPRAAGRGHRHQVHQGLDADPAQRLPAAEAAAGLSRE